MAKYESESVTDIPTTTFTHKWSIKNFTIIPTDKEFIYSPDFSPPFSKDKWYMRLKPKRTNEANGSEHMGIMLYLRSCEDKKKQQVRAKFVISVLDTKYDRRIILKCRKPQERIFTAGQQGHGWTWLLPPRYAAEDTPGAEDTLQVLCEITVCGEMTSRLLETVLYTEKEMAVGCLSNDVCALLGSQEASDTIVETKDGVQIKVHKFILKMRSKVFKAMFEHDMVEKVGEKIMITDFETSVIKEMINFIYTDNVTDIGDIAGDLLMAVDKYDLPKLKKICEGYLAANTIRADTCVYLLTLSDSCNCPKLKEKVMEYITANATEVCETAE